MTNEVKKIEDSIETNEFEYVMVEEIEKIRSQNMGIESIKPLLQLVERHPMTDFGMPGPIVHYVETFYDDNNPDEYLSILIDSIRCRPSRHTIWMLNRVKNAVQDKSIILSVFQDIVDNLSVEQELRDLAEHFKNI